jgi:hypothetical protein
MTTTGTVGVTPAEKAAEAAWSHYASTCRMGGTPAERRWAFTKALKAERKASRLELARRAGR